MMNQPLNEAGKGIYYRGSIDCLTQAVKNEGNVSWIIDPLRYRYGIVKLYHSRVETFHLTKKFRLPVAIQRFCALLDTNGTLDGDVLGCV